MKKKIIPITLVYIVISLFSMPDVAAQQFGKNKMQYKNFDWKYIESKHFDVYYDAGSKYLAEFAAIELEKALVSIQKTLNFQITQRIAVVVYNSHNEFQQTNVINMYLSQGIGGVTELYKNRVVVPFQGSYAQLRHVLHHELVHAVINDMFYGGTVQTAVTANGVFFLPTWLNEGLAEWESIGGMDIETDMFMRDLTINEDLPALKEISGYLSYRAGQTFYAFIADRYGKGKVTEFVNKLKSYQNLEIAFMNTFGISFEDFSELWQTEIKKVYWPDITVYQPPKEFATQITNHAKEDCFYFSSPAIAPDGEQMAYISDMDAGIFAIYVSPIETATDKKKKVKPRKLVSSARQQDFEQLNILTPGISWSPDSKKIVISAKSGGEDAIFITDVKTGKYDKIKPGFSTISSVIWSPDGSKIAFIGTKNAQSDIYYYDLADKKVIAVTNDVFSDHFPVWAPDSKSIYYISDRGDNLAPGLNYENYRIWEHDYKHADIYNVDISTNKISRITNEPEVMKTSVVVSSDNKKLLYVSMKNGIGNIYELNLTSNIERPLTNSANGIAQLSITPDNLSMIFSAQVEGGYDIFLMRNPFEKQIDTNVLPLTGFMKKNSEKSHIISEIVNADTVENMQDTVTPVTYGEYTTDFTQQQFVRPNTDVLKPVDDYAANTSPLQDSAADDFIEKDYIINFSLDAVFVNPAISTLYGLQGDGVIMFSDIMGNHQIFLQAYLLTDLKNSQFYGGYFYNSKIIDYSFAVYNNSAYIWTYLNDPEAGVEEGNYLYSYRSTGVVLGSKYAFDLFKRVELKLNLVNAAKENTEIPSYESISRFLFVPEVQFVIDNSLNGIYAPTRGQRINFRGLFSPRFTSNSSEFLTLTMDARQYIEIIPNWMSIALRGSAGISIGDRAQTFYMGGVNNWINSEYENGNFTLDNPEDFAFIQNFLMPMRGWPVSALKGDKFFMANIEYRFPIFMAFMAGGFPMLIQGVMGNVFFDIGGAWTDDFRISYTAYNGNRYPANMLMSAGWGIRAIVLGMPFKFDMAWRNEYFRWSSPYYIFALGLDF